jgi:surfeit locus 1 family protein
MLWQNVNAPLSSTLAQFCDLMGGWPQFFALQSLAVMITTRQPIRRGANHFPPQGSEQTIGLPAVRNVSTKTGIASYIVIALVFAILAGFGTWQAQRRTWKEALLRTIAERQTLAPATVFDPKTLGCAPDKGLEDPCDFSPIRLSGRITDPMAVHIFISIPRQANGLVGNGYWVFRRFEPTDGSTGLWVNTGFIPADKKATALPPPGDSVITGMLRRAEPRGRFSGSNDLKNNVYFVRDPTEFPAAPGLERSYYIDMTGPVPPSGLPYPMAGKQAIANRHLEYALTWFGLAATWLVVAGVAIRRRSLNSD